MATISGLAKRAGTHRGKQADVPRLRLAALPGALATQPAQSRTKSRAGHGGGSNVDAVGGSQLLEQQEV